MSPARDWTIFVGALFSLMGVSLFAGARRSAEDALAWQKEWRHAVGVPEPTDDQTPRRRFLENSYRFGGLFFAGVGLGLLWAGATVRAAFSSGIGGRDGLTLGAVFLLGGAVMAFNSWRRRRRAPRFLEGELIGADAPLPAGERVASACSNAIIALMLAFGLRLLREGLR